MDYTKQNSSNSRRITEEPAIKKRNKKEENKEYAINTLLNLENQNMIAKKCSNYNLYYMPII